MKHADTTEWALGMGGWWRRERGAILRVRTRAMPPRDEDAAWTCEIDLRNVDLDAPYLTSFAEATATDARAWCDRWAETMLRAIVRGPASQGAEMASLPKDAVE